MALVLQLRRLKQSVSAEFSAGKAPLDNDDASKSSNGHDEEKGAHVDVEFGRDDPNNPQCWSGLYKTCCIVVIWLMVFVAGWSSSADATAHEVSAVENHVSQVAESLATSMFLFGVAVGAVFAGPCSEAIGRLPVYLGTFAIYLIWTMASALSPTFAAQIIFRGLAGLFASATMSIYGGSLADLLDTDLKAKVWPLFALSPLMGPTIAPIANGWITQRLGPRWDDWITLIISGAVFIAALFILPETHGSTILWLKAHYVRQATGKNDYRCKAEKDAKFADMLGANMRRIVTLMCTEVTTVLFGLYITLVFSLNFGFLEGFDYIFSKTYAFDTGRRYTAFTAVAVGIVLALPYIMVLNSRTHAKGTTPEHRLEPALFAAPLLAVSLFWIGWTDRSSISYWSPLGGCLLFGFTLMSLFTPTYHYLLDCYVTMASSALAAITFTRYMVSGGMVLATEPLYTALTVKWMLTLLGCVAALLTPVPWVFWFYGPRIRSKSRYAKG